MRYSIFSFIWNTLSFASLGTVNTATLSPCLLSLTPMSSRSPLTIFSLENGSHFPICHVVLVYILDTMTPMLWKFLWHSPGQYWYFGLANNYLGWTWVATQISIRSFILSLAAYSLPAGVIWALTEMTEATHRIWDLFSPFWDSSLTFHCLWLPTNCSLTQVSKTTDTPRVLTAPHGTHRAIPFFQLSVRLQSLLLVSKMSNFT